MARPPVSALPARPCVFHRCIASRRCRDCGQTGSRQPRGRRTIGGVGTPVGRRSRTGCPRPGSRRCCSPSEIGWCAQASFLNMAQSRLAALRLVRLQRESQDKSVLARSLRANSAAAGFINRIQPKNSPAGVLPRGGPGAANGIPIRASHFSVRAAVESRSPSVPPAESAYQG